MADPVSIFTLVQSSVSLSIRIAEVVKILLDVVTIHKEAERGILAMMGECEAIRLG